MLAKIKSAVRDSLPNNINRIATVLYRIKAWLYYRWTFGQIGSRSYLRTPCYLSNTKFIYVGENSFIAKGARLEVVIVGRDRAPELRIGDNVNIEQNVHITCQNRVIIGSNVSIAPMCSIMDVTHPFDGADEGKIGDRLACDDSIVEIGEGSLIGVGCVVLPNVRIGRRCVIGANSVVTRDIPDRSIAAGSPARVLRTIS